MHLPQRIARRLTLLPALALLLGLAALTACETAPDTQRDKDTLRADVLEALALFKNQDPTLQPFFESAAGYAIFPTVGKGAVGIGGAYGKGELYEKGRFLGYCSLSQGTIGVQLGGQAYSEIIFFETADELREFKSGTYEFAAQASAVAAASGAAANAKYEQGVLVFTLAKGGLMFEASLGGQKFRFQPK